MADKLSWEAPPLTPEDERLIDAYLEVARPVDELPYTDHFDRLISLLSIANTQENKRAVFKRLLRLRKTGRLPRAGVSVSA